MLSDQQVQEPAQCDRAYAETKYWLVYHHLPSVWGSHIRREMDLYLWEALDTVSVSL